jgi:hypothetical protein
VVGDSAATLEVIGASVFEPVRYQPPPLRQRVLGTGGHFGERQAIVLPSDNVPGVRDLDVGRVAAAFDVPALMDFEQFRVQRPAIELKHQFGDTWANG